MPWREWCAPRTERALLQLFGASVPAAVMAHAHDRIEQLVVADAACVERVDEIDEGRAHRSRRARHEEETSLCGPDDPVSPASDH